VVVDHLLEDGTRSQELGAEYLDRLEPQRQTRQLVRRSEKLGHQVILEPRQDVA
jgi:hypothetical protein